MSQVESGIRSILSSPITYDLLQNIMGAKKARASFVKDHIKPQHGDNILDIGCGTCEILSFIHQRVNYYGFDQSSAYINHAQSKYGDRGTFKCAKVNALEIEKLPDMNIVLANGLIHHLDDDQVTTLLSVAKNSLTQNGRFIAIDPCYSPDQNIVAKWLIDRDRGNDVRNQKGYVDLAKSIFPKVESEVIHRKWIPYTHHVLICSL